MSTRMLITNYGVVFYENRFWPMNTLEFNNDNDKNSMIQHFLLVCIVILVNSRLKITTWTKLKHHDLSLQF